MREQWWVFLIALGMAGIAVFFKAIWLGILTNIGLIIYFLFWLIQFYGVTQLSENKIIFDRLSYEITSRQMIMQIDAKHGMPILWEQIKRVRQGKDFFLLVVSTAHLIHLPYKIFNSKNEVKFLETTLKRKGLLK